MADRKSKAAVAAEPVRPFLKWVGGKRRLVPRLTKNLPPYRTYFEPLLGGGALFFALRPKRAVLSDTNAELVDCFIAVRDDVDGVIKALGQHRYIRRHYYKVRDQLPQELRMVDRAALRRMLTLYQAEVGPAAKLLLKQELGRLGLSARALRTERYPTLVQAISTRIPGEEPRRIFVKQALKLVPQDSTEF